MDFQEISKAVAVPEILFDDFDEQPVDCDFVLPDYCPDIAAVLKCTMRPVIQSKQMSGDRLTAEGQAMIRVMYLDEGRKCVRCCEFSQPFTSSFAVRGAGVGAEIRLTAKTELPRDQSAASRSARCLYGKAEDHRGRTVQRHYLGRRRGAVCPPDAGCLLSPGGQRRKAVYGQRGAGAGSRQAAG